MTWNKIDDLTPEEVASMAHLLLYAAVDGMEGSDLESFQAEDDPEKLRYEHYWHGCVETAVRSMAFLFAETKYANGDGIGIGDAVGFMKRDLEGAAILLMTDPRCPHCKQTIRKGVDRRDRTNRAEQLVDIAAKKFFDVWAPPAHASAVANALKQQQSEREASRRKAANR